MAEFILDAAPIPVYLRSACLAGTGIIDSHKRKRSINQPYSVRTRQAKQNSVPGKLRSCASIPKPPSSDAIRGFREPIPSDKKRLAKLSKEKSR